MNYEKEVKVLDINIESTMSKLQEIGATYVGKNLCLQQRDCFNQYTAAV